MVGVLIIRSIDALPDGALSQILGYAFALLAFAGCIAIVNKYIAPRVEATDGIWDGFALVSAEWLALQPSAWALRYWVFGSAACWS